MTLRAQIASDAVTVFCNTNDFAEAVVYYPLRGCPRSINAVVIRETVTTFTDDQQNVLAVFEVHVPNDKDDGISSIEINVGGDSIGFPSRDGKTATKKTIHHIVSQDNGMLVLQCL